LKFNSFAADVVLIVAVLNQSTRARLLKGKQLKVRMIPFTALATLLLDRVIVVPTQRRCSFAASICVDTKIGNERSVV
jgi:hypothetical protein